MPAQRKYPNTAEFGWQRGCQRVRRFSPDALPDFLIVGGLGLIAVLIHAVVHAV